MNTGDNDILLNDLIGRYLRIAELCWPELKALSGGEEIDDDLAHNWLQVQWELVVEQTLNTRGHRCSLLIYGNGAETETSRVFYPDAVETHAVCCRPKSGRVLHEHLAGKPVEFPAEGYALDEFVNLAEAGFQSEPPYNGVMVVHGQQDERPVIFALDQLDFLLTPLRSDTHGRVSLRSVAAARNGS